MCLYTRSKRDLSACTAGHRLSVTGAPPMRWRALVMCGLVLATLVLIPLEQSGHVGPPRVALGGDLRREAQFFGQFGQLGSVCIAMLLIWRLDERRRPMLVSMVLCLAATAVLTAAMKHGLGRVRPGYARRRRVPGSFALARFLAGEFPSGHAASARRLTVLLSAQYPRAKAIFWGLRSPARPFAI